MIWATICSSPTAIESSPHATENRCPAAAPAALGEDLRAAAIINLGIAEAWALRFEDAKRHLE